MLNYYKHVNSPEGRMYLSRQLFEEALHVQFYLTLLDTYLPDPAERAKAFSAVDNIPSIRTKAEFAMKWIESSAHIERLETREDRKAFLMNMITFASAIEGMFFFAAFAYVYFLRSRGLLDGLAAGTNWVFRDESMHMNFAFRVVDTAREEEPELFDEDMVQRVEQMLREAVECEMQFAEDVLKEGVTGLPLDDMRTYLESVADQRMERLGLDPIFNSSNPFPLMDLQDVQELTNFFERRVSAYQSAVEGEVSFDAAF